MSSRGTAGLTWQTLWPTEGGTVGDVWSMVHAERAALIDDLKDLDSQQWEEPSLCAGWTVHDVVAHLVDSARTTRLGFVVGLARARFDFDRQNARGVEHERGASPHETLERLVQLASRRWTPPAPLDTRLVEAVVHGEDIRRPLALTRSYPREAVVRSLRLQARTPASFGGAKELVARVRLTATDADVSIGDGPEVSGTALSLLLARVWAAGGAGRPPRTRSRYAGGGDLTIFLRACASPRMGEPTTFASRPLRALLGGSCCGVSQHDPLRDSA